jgi:NarL family two-component system sensor histidine kinase YdfH
MNKTSKSEFHKVDRDPLLFMGFLTLIVGTMYIVTLINVPAVRQPATFIIFTLLVVIHVVLHWFLYKIVVVPGRWVAVYIIGQGLLAFTITMISNWTGMVFALFMGLIGESVGLLGLKRWGLLAIAYYLALSMIAFTLILGPDSVGWWALGTIPVVIFIVIYVTLYSRQAEAREQAQRLLIDLEKANQQLSEYADRVEDLTISNERQRMARELHDTLSQGLAGLILQLEAADANLAKDQSDRARVIIQQSMQQARTTLESSRRAIDNLRQPEPKSLEEAIRQEASCFSNSAGIPCELHLDLPLPVSESVQDAIIRSVAEALTNIARHADANRVELVAVIMGKQLNLTIKDDGKGFDPENIPAGHYGILGIRERIRLAGGQMEIRSSSQTGTTLALTIPINDVKE